MSDLYKVAPTIPVSELTKYPNSVFAQLAHSHILLTRQGKAAGVLVHPTVWNRILEQLDNDEATIWALEAELNLTAGKSELIDVSDDELKRWMTDSDRTARKNGNEAKVIPDALPA